ncbi:hypothetical protein [Thermus sp.]|uniref:hypothetical protein n=1 Tax=Thermus sp. TaxID=275 RepID=UPI00307E4036
MKTSPWKKMSLGLAVGILLLALAQVEWYPPDFGPYETLRAQAHAQCQAYQAQGAEAYFTCLGQVSAAACYGPYASPGNFTNQMACGLSASAGYPAPGKAVLTAQSYRLEVAGGFYRERDPATNQILKERRETPRLAFTLERTGNGLYQGVSYDEQGQPQGAYWVTPACEIVGRNGRPTMDGILCPLFPEKPYLLRLLPSPDPSVSPVPSPVVYKGGRLLDDFDGDGVAEVGYMQIIGGSGRGWGSGGVEAFGYDPNTGRLKYHYALFGNQGGSAGNFLQEILILYRVR